MGSGDKLVNSVRPALDATDSSVSGNARNMHKPNASVVRQVLLCSALGRPAWAKIGVPGGDQISESDLNEAGSSHRNTSTIERKKRSRKLQTIYHLLREPSENCWSLERTDFVMGSFIWDALMGLP